jgi:Flp pilus assembly protein TadG
MIPAWLKRTSRGTAAVEFALITTFFVAPLLIGSADYVSIVSARAQLNTAMQSLYYFAITNPTLANNITDTSAIITTIDAASDFQIISPANMSAAQQPSLTYYCYTTSSTAATTPTLTANASAACGTGNTTLTYATYTLTVNLALPVPIPGLTSLTTTGSTQISSLNN